MTDIEIARSVSSKNIHEVASSIGVSDYIEMYGHDKAKIDFSKIDKKRHGKLILVTAINPTPYGEGKTTVSIGLHDGLCQLGKKSVAVLREPSLGPVFGIKGGATGGGYSQVIPMEDINLHFTGDFHAITSANNLISAAIDNHIHFGNLLQFDFNRIVWKRCLDLNDRALRNVFLGDREEHFQITAASEMMSILCLSKDMDDLKRRVGNILVGYNIHGKAIYARELKVVGAVCVLLKDAIKPNLVQSLEGNPVIIHGGPFANIAHGCNSVIATDLGLKLADYVVTEAGFGSDLGAEKFFDIKCRKANLKPDCVVLVVTVKALKHHGNGDLNDGLSNLRVHIENMLKYTSHVVVSLNQYDTDTSLDIQLISDFVKEYSIPFAINKAYSFGGKGATSLAHEVISMCDRENDFRVLYPDSLSLKDKIEKICKDIYHAKSVHITDDIMEKINIIEKNGYGSYPVCIAKTQYSISDNPKLLGYPTDFEVSVRDVALANGGEFVIIYLGSIMTMPGLGRESNYENIDIDHLGKIEGIF